MFVDAEVSITIRLKQFYVNSNSTDEQINKTLLEEGEKRMRHYLSGYLYDPDGKVIDKKVIIKNTID